MSINQPSKLIIALLIAFPGLSAADIDCDDSGCAIQPGPNVIYHELGSDFDAFRIQDLSDDINLTSDTTVESVHVRAEFLTSGQKKQVSINTSSVNQNLNGRDAVIVADVLGTLNLVLSGHTGLTQKTASELCAEEFKDGTYGEDAKTFFDSNKTKCDQADIDYLQENAHECDASKGEVTITMSTTNVNVSQYKEGYLCKGQIPQYRCDCNGYAQLIGSKYVFDSRNGANCDSPGNYFTSYPNPTFTGYSQHTYYAPLSDPTCSTAPTLSIYYHWDGPVGPAYGSCEWHHLNPVSGSWSNQGKFQGPEYGTEIKTCDVSAFANSTGQGNWSGQAESIGASCPFDVFVDYRTTTKYLIQTPNGENGTLAGEGFVMVYDIDNISITNINGIASNGGQIDLVKPASEIRKCVKISDANTNSTYGMNPRIDLVVDDFTAIDYAKGANGINPTTDTKQVKILKGLDESMRFWISQDLITAE